MPRAFRPSSGWNHDRGFPDLNSTWRGYHIEPQVTQFLRIISGVQDHPSQELLSLLFPHVTGFRLLMTILTHPLWPLPIWGALQVRNRLLMRRLLEAGDTGDLIARVAGWRVLEKGIEVDLHTQFQQGDDCAWESVVTFYYRGRFGSPTQHGTGLGAAPISPVIDDHSTNTEEWCINGSDRWSLRYPYW
jgi:hypothetical protein